MNPVLDRVAMLLGYGLIVATLIWVVAYCLLHLFNKGSAIPTSGLRLVGRDPLPGSRPTSSNLALGGEGSPTSPWPPPEAAS